MSKKKSLPKFKNIPEEADFWDTHDITDYIVSDKSLDLVYEPTSERKESMTLRIAPSLKNELEHIAKTYDISVSSLVRMWIVDKIRSLNAPEYLKDK